LKKNARDLVVSTSILGGSQVFSIILGMVRTKLFAIYLGPAGIGILSALNSTIELITQVFTLGTNSSVVREVASIDKDNIIEIKVALNTIKTITLLQAIAAAIFTFIFSDLLSYLTFSSYDYSFELRILSLAVFISIFYKMNIAVIEGLMVIKKYAFQTILSTLIVVAIASLLVIFTGKKGIVLIIISSISIHFLISNIFQRHLIPKMELKDYVFSRTIAKNIFYLGLAVLSGGLISAFVEYFTRIYLIRNQGLVTVGYLYAAQSLSLIYTSFILASIGKIYFPKLSSIKNDRDETRKLINDQSEIGMLLAFPGLMLILMFSSYLIPLLYSKTFYPSIEILYWLILVAFLKVASWPLSYYLVAVNSWKSYLLSEIFSNLLFVVFLLLIVENFGIIGVGIAGVIQYVGYILILQFLIYRNQKIMWDLRVSKLLLSYFVVFLLFIFSFSFVKSQLVVYFAAISIFALILDAVNRLSKIIYNESIIKFLRKKLK